jgi:ATP-dependent DNA helicase RecG
MRLFYGERQRLVPAQYAIRLTTSIADVPGVGESRALGFRKLGIRCIADLLLHLPMRYEHELEEQTICEAIRTVSPAHGSEANIAVQGEIATTRTAMGRRPRVEATIQDGTGTMALIWFNAAWMRRRLHPGMRIRAWGKAKRHGDYLQLVNPQWQPIDDKTPVEKRSERFRPVYPGSEDVPSTLIEKAIDAVLEPALAQLDEHLHEGYRRKRALPALAEAYRFVHRPANDDEVKAGRRRLAFDELLMLQLGVMLKRRHRRDAMVAPALKHSAAIDRHIIARFPFTLTESQRQVIDEITADLTRATPMNRLLQGDVGSGKTVVALYAMLMAVASEHQAALMAPTEILAEQHYASITRMLSGGRVRIELLTGSLKPAQRRDIHERLAAGEIDILIGTHALLTEKVSFHSLAVVVIDEQHRFGVHQRATLRAKAGDDRTSPHILVMTATPIPRTLSLTVFGDLDISTIRSMPPGR